MSGKSDWKRVAAQTDITVAGCKVVRGGRFGIAIFHHDGQLFAVDNRCPHMGFPLHMGTVKDGILTCHWHHARFDLCSGGTFDPFADDVPTYPVEVRDGDVWLDLAGHGTRDTEYWQRRLQESLEQELPLVTAKAVLAMLERGSTPAAVEQVGALYGTTYRAEGWGPGLTILTAMGNIIDRLWPQDRFLALYQGLVRVSADTRGRAPRFGLTPLANREVSPQRLEQWLRNFVEVRDAEGSERCLLTAIEMKLPADRISGMLFAAATDHFYLDGGHTLDFINKACEALDRIGWEAAPHVLPSLVRQLCMARRAEELSAWRHPEDLVDPVRAAVHDLPDLLNNAPNRPWQGHATLAETLLGTSPTDTVAALREALGTGAAPQEVAKTLAYAAAVRMARFNTRNEFADWIAVLHTFTYSNALYQALCRTSSPDLVRGIFHGAMQIYLDRFLNVPPARLPWELSPQGTGKYPDEAGANQHAGEASDLLQNLLETLDVRHQVEPAAAKVDQYLAAGHPPEELLACLGRALLREDAEFHTFQALEAGIRQYDAWQGGDEGRMILVAVARYLAAHAPTQRELGQTAAIASRLHRGETLHTDNDGTTE